MCGRKFGSTGRQGGRAFADPERDETLGSRAWLIDILAIFPPNPQAGSHHPEQ